MKICDLTQFYSPRSGGVKRYIQEKIRFLQSHSPDDEHVLIVPGARSELSAGPRSRVYSIASPLVSRSTRYRVLLNLRAVDEIMAHERPDIIESADPYQLGWKAAAIARARAIPAVAFYHSDFANAYLRPAAEWFGTRGSEAVMRAAENYARELYDRFELTLAPSYVADRLREWGVREVRAVALGVDTEVFKPEPESAASIRTRYKIPPAATLLIYVGRLAPEKNTDALFKAFELLELRRRGQFHLLVVGDGQQRHRLQALQASTAGVTWLPYCADPTQLAALYRAADLFVHPGTQETFGLVALESQACGTPVVGIRGSALDGIILHDQRAWASENSADALADAVERATTFDLLSMGAAAAEAVAERYAWRQVFDQLFCIYREVCATYKRRGVE